MVKRKKKRNEPHRRLGNFASPKCHFNSIFSKNIIEYSWLTLATVDGWPNILILATSCLNFLFYRQRIKYVQTVQSLQLNSQLEKQRCSRAKSEPLKEIREDLDRIAVKRKEESKGFLVEVHPCKRKKKCQVLWVGQVVLVLQKHAYDYALFLKRFISFDIIEYNGDCLVTN